MALPPVLMYHRIGSAPPGTIVPGHYVTPRSLARHLRLLQARGMKSIRPADCLVRDLGAVLITFDDGYADFARSAAPLLRASGFTATVFVCTGLLGGDNVWDTEIGDVREPLMDAATITQQAADGFGFGVHTAHHVDLTQADPARFEDEIREPRACLESLTGAKVEDFCYPYGRHNDGVRQAVRDAGFTRAFATGRGIPGDAFAIGRINVRQDTTALVLAYKLLRHRLRRGR